MRISLLPAIALLIPASAFWLTNLPAAGPPIRDPSCDALPPNCAAVPEPNCAPRQPSCEAPKKPCPPCEPTPPPAAMMTPQPMGVFVQPPATGAVRGPVSQVGVEGATITFPELSLRMPSIRFPSIAKYRSNARMEMAPAHAPYIEQPVAAPYAAAPYAAAPMMAPYAAPQMMAAPMMATPYAGPMMQVPYQQPPAAPIPPAAAPPVRAPDCAATNNATAALDPLEEKLRRIEAAERRLQAQVDELHRCLKQLPANPNAPTVVPPQSNRIPLRPIGPIGSSTPDDASETLAPPLPPPDFGRRPKGFSEHYPAQPAAYYSNQVIREPGTPRGQITALRAGP